MQQVKVTARQPQAHNVISLTLSPIDQPTLPNFQAGAHIDLHLGNGLIRQYSLCHSPSSHHDYQIAVKLEQPSRGGSAWIHDQLKVGDVLTISEPKNVFHLADEAKHHVLFAGGIGITPLLSMAQALLETDASFELHYSAQSPDEAAFYQQMTSSGLQHHTQFYFNREGQCLDAHAVLAQQSQTSDLYVCGPQGYIDYVFECARTQGWEESRLHRELFHADPCANSSDNQPFELHLANTGQTFTVPAHSTVLEVLLDAGVDVPFSCEEGVCGTCITRVLAGEPDHRDHYLTPQEQASNQEFLPCCSRAKSASLTIEL